MPPRKAAQPSPSSRARIPAPSPARSTRSARGGHRGDEDDDWETGSVQSTFKAPNSRSSKPGANTLGMNGTSVNVANAFHTAQSANNSIIHPPTPTSDRGSRAKPPPKKSTVPTTANLGRAQSPSEQLASVARALSPVRFFLRPGDDEDTSGEYSSFASFGNGEKSGRSGEMSYDYTQEDKFVKAAQAARSHGSNGHVSGPRLSDPKKRSGKSRNEDLPYRPAEEDEVYDSEDSVGSGEGLVKAGALNGRAGVRGKRQEKGEGYLGMGLGLQPRTSTARRNRRSGDGEGVSSGEEDDVGQHTPHPELRAGTAQSRGYRSPTPVQLLRALTPRIDRSSPVPLRRRQPSSFRTVITNLLHGVVLTLRFVVELVTGLIQLLLVKPISTLLRQSKSIARHFRQDWWKYLGGLVALGLALRLLEQPWKSRRGFSAPDLPPSSMDELVARLTSLEHGLEILSASSRALTEAETLSRKRSDGIEERVDDLQGFVKTERKAIEGLRAESVKSVKDLSDSLGDLQREVGGLSGRLSKHELVFNSYTRDSSTKFENVNKHLQTLQDRVVEVERGVKDALDDGRLRSMLERILPSSMPVKINSGGTVDIDPTFWTEMKKVLISRNEVQSFITKAVSDASVPMGGKSLIQENEEELERWADRVFEKKSRSGLVISKQSFLDVLESEISSLRHLMESLPASGTSTKSSSSSTNPPKSSVTIKSNKGEDITPSFMTLIEAALLRYSKDTIARKDYALFTSGARVVPSITSDTLVMSSPGVLGRWVMGKKDIQGLSPATALHPDISVGNCWPFAGGVGQLGVWLNRRVVVSDLTVEHASKELALDMGSAPREVEVWGLVEGKENQQKVETYLTSTTASSASIPPSPNHLLLATFTYDPTSTNHIQTFPVPQEIVELGIDMGIVVFKIQSNWGADFTCLYRVRVHGEPLQSQLA